MHSDLCLVLDQGSHSSRALIFDRFGVCHAHSSVPIRIQYTPPNRAEQDPEDILLSLKRAALEALSRLKHTDRMRLRSAALISQRSSVLYWDADSGEAMSPVLSWQDRRGSHYIEKLGPKCQLIRQKTGLYPNAHAPASKLRWCMEHLRFNKVAHRIKCGPVSSWLIKNLVKDQPDLIDGVTAARTMLYSLQDNHWDPELLELFQLKESTLPRIVPCQYEFGQLKLAGCDLPLRFSSGDQAAALFAFGHPSPERLYINLGSGGFLNRIQPKQSSVTPLRMLQHLILAGHRASYSTEATINGAANALDWGFNICRPHSRNLDQWANQIEHPPLFLNMVGGVGSPDWCPMDRSQWLDDEDDPKAKLVGIMESILFLIQRNIQAMDSFQTPESIYIGGGISNLNSLCQKLADLTGIEVIRYHQKEITALGAAWLTLANSQRNQEPEKIFYPQKNSDLLQRYQRWSVEFSNHLERVSSLPES